MHKSPEQSDRGSAKGFGSLAGRFLPWRRSTLQARRACLAAGLLLAAAATVWAAKPEDVFKGRVIILSKRIATRFPSEGAFVGAIQKAKTDRVWPQEEKGNDHAVWNLEYMAFFARPLNDNEVNVKFFEISGGSHRYVAGDQQYTRDKATRMIASNILLTKPSFETNKRYMMTVESRRRVIASATFWLRGKGASYTGKVEFSDEDVKAR
jgi:hypothetical protein